jgi:hypothetical protein
MIAFRDDERTEIGEPLATPTNRLNKRLRKDVGQKNEKIKNCVKHTSVDEQLPQNKSLRRSNRVKPSKYRNRKSVQKPSVRYY